MNTEANTCRPTDFLLWNELWTAIEPHLLPTGLYLSFIHLGKG